MARHRSVWGLVVLSLALAVPAESQQKPRAQSPKKPPAAKPAPKPPAPAPEPPPPPPATDVKVVTSYTHGAQVSQNTTYVKGARQRVEFPGMVSIDQCDLQRTLVLSPSAKKYRVQPYAAAGLAPAPSPDPAAAAMGTTAKGGVVVLTTSLTDTLERQTMFGLQARRIKTVLTKQADATACDKTPLRVEIDAWYVDLPKAGASCTRPAAAAPEPAGGCQDRIEARVVGDVSLGFPVKTVTTTITGEGDKQEAETAAAEVTALDVTRLDAALFDPPADYTEATSAAELMPAMARGASLEDALFGSTADGTSQAAPKKPGVTRIGVLEPLNKSSRTLNTQALRADLTGKFKAPYEALPLNGSSAAAIEADAKRLECDYILLAEITEVKSSKPGKIGGLLKAASGGGAPAKETQEVKAKYTLYATVNTSSPRTSGDVKASSAGGFGLGSALKVASFAGQMYMGMGMMKGMGGLGNLGSMGLGMGMNPMAAVASVGGLGPMAGSLYDPRAAAVSSMSMSMGMGLVNGAVGTSGGMVDPAEGDVYQTVSASFGNVAKGTTGALAGKK